MRIFVFEWESQIMHNFISHYFQGWERWYYLKREDKKLLTLISNSIVIQMIIIANPIDRKLKSDAIAARHYIHKGMQKMHFLQKMVFDPSFNWSYIIEFEMSVWLIYVKDRCDRI